MTTRRLILTASVTLCGLVLSFSAASAQMTTNDLINLKQWRAAEGGNDHWYGIAPTLVIQPEADSMAGTLTLDTLVGYLATVLDAEENEFIRDSVLPGVDPPSIIDQLWMGGYFFADSWYWFSNEPWEYANWAPGEPNNLGRETALAMVAATGGNPGFWNNATPDRRYVDTNVYWFLVEFGDPYSTVAPPQDTLVNLVQWTVEEGGNGHWYAIWPKARIWQDAEIAVGQFGVGADTAYLATVTSAEENNFIQSQVVDGVLPDTYLQQLWLGGRYFAGSWTWSTGESFGFQNWAPGEPNNLPNESAIVMKLDGEWNNATPDTAFFDQNFHWSIIEIGPPDTIIVPTDTLINLVQWPVSEGGNDHWYAVLPQPLIWQDAETAARSYEINGDTSYLATPTSPEENAFISGVVLDGVDPNTYLDQLWLGGRYVGLEWIWTTGEQFNFVNWASGEPNNLPNESAIAMRLNGLWNNATPDTAFFDQNFYWAILEFGPPDTTVIPEDTLINLVQWPVSEGGNDHWYAVLPRPLMWQDANAMARQFHIGEDTAYLATVTLPEENSFISSVVLDGVDPNTYLDQLWLGGGYVTGAWSWVTDEPFSYTNWAPGEPNNLPDESAIAMRLDGRWNNATPDTAFFDQNFYWAIIEIGPPDTSTVPEDTLFNLVQWPVSEGGNDHWYAVFTSQLIWPEALDEAGNWEVLGLPGHLAAVGSAAENDFIMSHVLHGIYPPGPVPQLWIGGYWQTDQWAWTTGEPFAYDNWAAGEPNNLPTEAALAIRTNGEWNNATPDESIVTGNRYWSVVEFESCCIGRTGNVNGDPNGEFDLSDIIYLIKYLFLHGPQPPCMAAANLDGDPGCRVDLVDLIYGAVSLFFGGMPPAGCNPNCP